MPAAAVALPHILICRRCDHPLAAHCKGNQLHTDHKEESRMIPLAYRKASVICQTRHCENPLCSCVDFVETMRRE